LSNAKHKIKLECILGDRLSIAIPDSVPTMESKMAGKKNFNYWILAASACGLAMIVTAATCAGLFVGLKFADRNGQFELPTELQLQAGTAARGKSMSMATGRIDNNVEGLFVLDHDSGNLQCWILNAKTGAVGAIYRTNVVGDLKVDKSGEPDFVMTTGNFFWSSGVSGQEVPAHSVVYVGDSSTGNVVGYSFTYNKQALHRGAIQNGVLEVICKGAAKEGLTRDQ
jgi:hypothetical protein